MNTESAIGTRYPLGDSISTCWADLGGTVTSKKWLKQARGSSLWQITVCLATVSESAGMPHTEGSHPEWEREPSEA